MLLVRCSLVAAAALVLPACALVARPELARCLPDGVRMDDFVEVDRLGLRVSVAGKLARLGAYAGPDGKLYDRGGRPIAFWRHYDGGMCPPAGRLEAAADRLKELKRTHTVIEMFHDPRAPLPV
jgi:hypothetical protein